VSDNDADPKDAPAEKPPFSLREGAAIQYGHRRGKVEVVRGGGPTPYDVRIRWEHEKYSEWFLYGTLESLYKAGEFGPSP